MWQETRCSRDCHFYWMWFLWAQSRSVHSDPSAGEFRKWVVGVRVMWQGEEAGGTLCPWSKTMLDCLSFRPQGFYSQNLQGGLLKGYRRPSIYCLLQYSEEVCNVFLPFQQLFYYLRSWTTFWGKIRLVFASSSSLLKWKCTEFWYRTVKSQTCCSF